MQLLRTEPESSDHLIWTETARKTVLSARVFSVALARRRSTDGRKADFTVVESPDWCNVIAPVTREGVRHLVMVRQYRHGSGSVTTEIPGGIVDPGESPEEAALRELEEEAGYTAGGLTLIGRMNPNPAFMGNTVYTYVANGVRSAGEQRLDENEQADKVLLPEATVLSLTNSEFIAHAIMVAAVHWYRLFLNDGLDFYGRMAADESTDL